MNRTPLFSLCLGIALLGLATMMMSGCETDSEPASGGADTSQSDGEVGDPTDGEYLVVINEISTGGEEVDWIELYNAGESSVDIGDWRLTDDDPTHVALLAPGRLIEPGEHLLLLRDDPGGFAFGLSGTDAVSLFDDGGVLQDFVAWSSGDAPNDLSYGRIPDGQGDFTTLETPSPGAENVANPTSVCGDGVAALDEICDAEDLKEVACEDLEFTGAGLGCAEDCQSLDTSDCSPISRLVVINEVSSSGDDPVELYNPGDEAVDLSGWRLTDDDDAPKAGAHFFSTGTVLEPGEFKLLTKGADHGFGLGGSDEVRLRDTAGLLVDRVTWSKGQAEISWCRVPDGTGAPQACAEGTYGTTNVP